MSGEENKSSESSSKHSTFKFNLTDTTPLLCEAQHESSSKYSSQLSYKNSNIKNNQNNLIIQQTSNFNEQHYYTNSVCSLLSSQSFDNRHCSYENNKTSPDEAIMCEESSGNTSWIVATFLLINASLGAGLLNYPVAYNRLGGIATATVIQFFALVLMATTMLTLVFCARLHNQYSYHGVMRTMCGKLVMQFSAASIAITCFGICVTFIIIVGDQFDRLLATYIGDDFCLNWFSNRYFTMSVVAIFTMWPMSYFRRLDFLRHINFLGVIASFYVIFLYIYNYYHRKSTIPERPTYKSWPDNSIEFIASLPVVFFAYQTHEIVIPVHVAMKDKSMKAFSKTTALSLVILLFLYCIAGTYGYLSYGDSVAADIMLMYDAHDPLVVGGIIALVIKMITTYPPVLFCGRDTIIRLFMSRPRDRVEQSLQNSAEESMKEQMSKRYKTLHLTITSIWNMAVLSLALITPNITIAIGFLGSLASANVFIFPGLALIGLARQFRSNMIQSKEIEEQEEEEEVKKKKEFFKSFRLENTNVQSFLMLYGAFIVAMGLLMCIIILWQMTRDLSNPTLSHELCKTSNQFQ